MKRLYVAPCVRKKVEIRMEQAILVGSTVEQRLEVETASQQVVDHDISGSGFIHDWK